MIWSVRDYRSRKTVARKPGYATSPQAHQRSAGWLLRFYINHVFVHFCSSTPVYVPSVYTINFFPMTADVIFFYFFIFIPCGYSKPFACGLRLLSLVRFGLALKSYFAMGEIALPVSDSVDEGGLP